MKKRVLAIILSIALVISAFSVMAGAIGEKSYRELDYSTTITPGTPVTGKMTWIDPTLISYSSTGSAKGFTVTLESGKTYVFNFKATTASDVTHAINIIVLNNVMSGGFANDVLSIPVVLSEYGKAAATSVRFTAPSSGLFKVIITEGSLVVDDYKLVSVDYTVSVDELAWANRNIANAADLTALRDEINSYAIPTANLNVKLTADIDMGNANWVGFKAFAGKFDGNNRRIFNFGLGSSSVDYSGLLGKVMGKAEVENVKIEGIVASGAANVGALAGMVENSSVENCSSAGSVSGISNVGGLIGTVSASDISDCTSSCTVTGGTSAGGCIGISSFGSDIESCSATGAVTGSALYTGGFIGSIDNTVIDECFATGAVTGLTGVGGFIGTIGSANTISDSYAKGTVTVKKALIPIPGLSVGGFAGVTSLAGNTIINCYCIGAINAYANRVAGFLGSCNATSTVTIKNCYTASAITIGRSSDSFSSFVGELDGELTAETCYASAARINLNGVEIAAVALPLNTTLVDFTDSEAVSQMTKKLNELPASNDDYAVWTGTNAANGPDLSYDDIDVPDSGSSFDDVMDWVKSQSVILQIPLYIFYVPIMYFVSLFRG